MEPPLRVKYPIGEYPLEDRMLIISYELGDICKNLFRFLYVESDRSRASYKADMKLGMADLVYQLMRLAQGFNWTLDELLALGTQHFVETKEDLESGKREA
jgi:hypothetical protein